MTKDAKPDPLVPLEVDLRDLDGFMLNVERLMSSELVALSTGDEFKAAVALWCRAWKQIPAASLPKDEKVLAAFSGAGRTWKRVRDMALRGFVECSDGRLYHVVLAQDALRAWEHKQRRQGERDADAERLRRWRDKQREKREMKRQMKPVSGGGRNARETETKRDRQDRTGQDNNNNSKSASPPYGDGRADAAPAGRQNGSRIDDQRSEGELYAKAGEAVLEALGVAGDPSWYGNYGRVQAWIDAGCDVELDILPTIRRSRAKRPDFVPRSLAYFDQAVADAAEQRKRGLAPGRANGSSRPGPRAGEGFSSVLSKQELIRNKRRVAESFRREAEELVKTDPEKAASKRAVADGMEEDAKRMEAAS